jgi:hypothetical protein
VTTAKAAEVISVKRASLVMSPESDAWLVNADIAVELPTRLEEAVNKGVPLLFVLELEVYRPRWYWWDESVLAASQSLRLSFHALSRTYRVGSLVAQQQYATLGEALEALGQVRGWRVAPGDRLRTDVNAVNALRLRLDAAQLPKPLQLSALTNKEWSLQSEWTRFPLIPDPGPSSAR